MWRGGGKGGGGWGVGAGVFSGGVREGWPAKSGTCAVVQAKAPARHESGGGWVSGGEVGGLGGGFCQRSA